MQATRLLAKLYDMPPEHGEVTAFDTYASQLYVGTDGGIVLHFHVEGLPEYSSPPATEDTFSREHRAESPREDGSSNGTADPCADTVSIYTNLLNQVVVSAQRQRVDGLQHSRTQSLLFVLTEHRLTVWRTAAATTATAAVPEPEMCLLAEIANNVRSFFVRPLWRPQHAPSSLSASVGTSSHQPLPQPPEQRRHTSDLAHRRGLSDVSAASGSTLGGTSSVPPVLSYSHSTTSAVYGNVRASHPSAVTAATATQQICITQHQGRRLLVCEFNAIDAASLGATAAPAAHSSDNSHGIGHSTGLYSSGAPRAVLKQELLLPEPALALTLVNNHTACVGLRQVYTLLSLDSGASRSVQRVSGTRPPLLALGDNCELHVRYGKAVVTMSLRGLQGGCDPLPRNYVVGVDGPLEDTDASTPIQTWPGAPTPTTAAASADDGGHGQATLGTGIPRLQQQRSSSAASTSNLSTFHLVTRTRPTGEAPELMVSRYPFLFAFTEHGCAVFSTYASEPVEQLPLAGVRFAAPLARGETMFVASSHSIWLVKLRPLRAQLADLVSCMRVDEAFELLKVRRLSSGHALREVELELRTMAGFMHLRHCKADSAVRCFGSTLDPRDLTLLVPECVPPSSASYSAALKRLLARDAAAVAAGSEDEETRASVRISSSLKRRLLTVRTERGPPQQETLKTEPCASSNPTTLMTESVTIHLAPCAGCADHEGRGKATSTDDYWYGWRGPCPYNTYTATGELQRAWLETFASYPLAPIPASAVEGSASNATATNTATAMAATIPPLPLLRFVPELGPVSSTRFLEYGWSSLKAAMEASFRRMQRQWACGSAHAPGGWGHVPMPSGGGACDRVSDRRGEASTSSASMAPSTMSAGDFTIEESNDPIAEEQAETATEETEMAHRSSLPFDAHTAARLRAVEYAMLILALERQDGRNAYALVSRGHGLQVADCYDLLLGLREYRLLAVLLWRRGFCVEAERLVNERESFFIKSSLTKGSKAGRNHDRWECGELGGLAMERLPRAMHALVRERLLKDHSDCREDRESNSHTTSESPPSPPAMENVTLSLHGRGQSVTFAHSSTGRSGATRLWLPVLSLHHHTWTTAPVEWLPAPGELSEVFVLIDRMDLVGLRAALHDCPALARCRDSRGRTPLHYTFAALAALEPRIPPDLRSPTDSAETAATVGAAVSAEREKSAIRNECGHAIGAAFPVSPRSTSRDADAAFLQLVLAAASLLVDYGCPVGCRAYTRDDGSEKDEERMGITCLDVAAAVCGGAFLDVIVASLLSCVEVSGVAHAAVREVTFAS